MASEGVGDRVRRYRRLRKLSQQQLADLAQTDKGYISRLEAGKIETPGADVLRRIARALDVPVRQLAEPLGWWDEEPAPDALAAAEAAVLSADISDEHRQAALVMLRALLRDRGTDSQQDGAAASGS